MEPTIDQKAAHALSQLRIADHELPRGYNAQEQQGIGEDGAHTSVIG